MKVLIDEKKVKIKRIIYEYRKVCRELTKSEPPQVIYNKGWFEIIADPIQRELNYKFRLSYMESLIQMKKCFIKSDRKDGVVIKF